MSRGGAQQPSVTIAIPTWNRAALLDTQLAWLARAIAGVEDRCEILVHDNASTDETPAVIDHWRHRLGVSTVKVRRQPTNIGAVRNIASCIRAAAGRHVWTISDDDRIDDDALRLVVEWVENDPDLTLLLLNFSSSMVGTGRLLFDRCFSLSEDVVGSPGGALFDQLLTPRYDSRWGGLALTTALVYRTDVANAALDSWGDDLDNLMVQLYVTAFCARQGRTRATARPYLESIAGRAHFVSDPAVYFFMRAVHVPRVLVRLAALGCSWRLCMQKLIERPGSFALSLPRLACQRPAIVVHGLANYGVALMRMLAIGVRRRAALMARVGT